MIRTRVVAEFVSNLRILSVDVVQDLYSMEHEHTSEKIPMISDFHYKIIMKNADVLNSSIIYGRDFNYNYFGFKVSIRIRNGFKTDSKRIQNGFRSKSVFGLK